MGIASQIIIERLSQVRQLMQQHALDAYLVPATDPHHSEYVPKCYQRRAWLCGFTGSAGDLLVTMDAALLWTDSRYFVQATLQLADTGIILMRIDEHEGLIQYLATKNWNIGIDPMLISIKFIDSLKQSIANSSKLIFIKNNLVSQFMPQVTKSHSNSAYRLSDLYSGKPTTKKLQAVREQLNNANIDYLLLNALDEIAWLFNIRGSDIDFNPLVLAYAILGKQEAVLFIDNSKITVELNALLLQEGIQLAGYDEFYAAISHLKGNIAVNHQTNNYAMLQHINKNSAIINYCSPIILQKSCKNTIEQVGARAAHAKDAIAVINFLCWLENHTGISELSAAAQLLKFREQQDGFVQPSFATISAFGAHAAIVHYAATEESNCIIDDQHLYLIDSGGQYLSGTTDITRTVHLGSPTVEEIHNFTLVLKGHLALARLSFPNGVVCGEHVDVLARQFLWAEGLNYGHGTGHGVGSFLCVHEGPQRISPAYTGVPLVAGMIVSDEPGLYLEGKYGIRIENLCLINASNSLQNFLSFEHLTLVPYQKNLIDFSILSALDIADIRQYYAKIKTHIAPVLGSQQQLWLARQLDV